MRERAPLRSKPPPETSIYAPARVQYGVMRAATPGDDPPRQSLWEVSNPTADTRISASDSQTTARCDGARWKMAWLTRTVNHSSDTGTDDERSSQRAMVVRKIQQRVKEVNAGSESRGESMMRLGAKI